MRKEKVKRKLLKTISEEYSEEDIERLERLSNKVRRGMPVDFTEAIDVMAYQEILKEQRQHSLWKRFKHWLKWGG